MASDAAAHNDASNLETPDHFAAVFDRLKAIMAPYADRLIVVTDEPDHFYLNTSHVMKNKQPLFFGAVQIKKRYVSYHLMPVYSFPDLLTGVDEELKKRMQGKSCFNFTKIDDATVAAIADLTRQGFTRYEREGLI
jgi:hypothetical protein